MASLMITYFRVTRLTGEFRAVNDKCVELAIEFLWLRGGVTGLKGTSIRLNTLLHFDGAVGLNLDSDRYDKMMSSDSSLMPSP